MIVGISSVKGAPGVTSSALALTLVWPRPVVLVEADVAGSDLRFRVRTAAGDLLEENRGIVPLAIAARQDAPSAGLLASFTQPLSETASVVNGVTGLAQARSLSALWGQVGGVCEASDSDVIIDFGRLSRDSDTLVLAQSCDVLLVAMPATIEGVHHAADHVGELTSSLAGRKPVAIHPLVVGPDTHAAADRRDIDAFFAERSVLVGPTVSLPYDPRGLEFVQNGDVTSNRARRSLLVRAANGIVDALIPVAFSQGGTS